MAEYTLDMRVSRRFIPYLGGAMGLSRVGREYYEAEGGDRPDRVNEFSVGLTGGAVMPIRPTMALQVGGAWTFVSPANNSATAEYALIRLGLVFNVGR